MRPSLLRSLALIFCLSLISTSLAAQHKVLERHENIRSSPGGEYLLYFLDNDWWSYHIPEGRHRNLTENLETRFNNYTFISGRENDQPFGAGQWAEGDEWVIIYDEFDIYKASPDGSGDERITHGADDRISGCRCPADQYDQHVQLGLLEQRHTGCNYF